MYYSTPHLSLPLFITLSENMSTLNGQTILYCRFDHINDDMLLDMCTKGLSIHIIDGIVVPSNKSSLHVCVYHQLQYCVNLFALYSLP